MMLIEAPTRQTPRAAAAGPLVDRYLRRLGLEREAPSVEALARVHRAQVETVPYETFWIHLGQRWGIDQHESLERLASSPRGGYCFQLNGALALVLAELGYDVTLHAAGVHDVTGPAASTIGNHVAVDVHGLAGDGNPTGAWYVDAGLGDVLHEPLPLAPCRRRQGPSRFSIEVVARAEGVGDWHLTNHDPASLAGVSIDARPVTIDRFLGRHEHNRTSADSSFARTVTAQRRHAAGSDVLRGCVLTQRSGSHCTTTVVERAADWLELLDDVFGIRLGVGPAAIESLWANVRTSHEAWAA